MRRQPWLTRCCRLIPVSSVAIVSVVWFCAGDNASCICLKAIRWCVCNGVWISHIHIHIHLHIYIHWVWHRYTIQWIEVDQTIACRYLILIIYWVLLQRLLIILWLLLIWYVATCALFHIGHIGNVRHLLMHLLRIVIWCSVVHLLACCYLLILIWHLILRLLVDIKSILWCTIWLNLRFAIFIKNLLLWWSNGVFGDRLTGFLQDHVVAVLWFLLGLLVRLIYKLLSVENLAHCFNGLLLFLVLVCFLSLCLGLILATQLVDQLLLLLYLVLKLLESLVLCMLCVLKVCIWHIKLIWKLVHLILRRLIHIIKWLADKAVSWAMHLIAILIHTQLWVWSILVHPIIPIVCIVILILKINPCSCRHLEILCCCWWTNEVRDCFTIDAFVLFRLWLVSIELHVILKVIVLAEVHCILLVEVSGRLELVVELVWDHVVNVKAVEVGICDASLAHV